MALKVVKPETRKTLIITIEKGLKLLSLCRLNVTRVISSREISVHKELDKL